MSTTDLSGVVIGCLGACLVIYVWSPQVRHVGIRASGTVIGLALAIWGFIYPLKQYLKRAQTAGSVARGSLDHVMGRIWLGAGLAGVALLGTWGSVQWAPKWAAELAKGTSTYAKEYTQIASAGGAVFGTIAAALACGRLGRRLTYALLCLGTIGVAIFFYQFNDGFGPLFLVSIFMFGSISAAFYGFFPLYFPELFPTCIRATAQGFAYNFGRVLAAVGSLQTATLIGLFQGSVTTTGSVMSAIYLIGLVLIWFAPETRGQPLPE